jgi:hypothetical protein
LGATPFGLRLLYTNILIHCVPKDPQALFEQFWEAMAAQWLRLRNPAEAKARLLRFIARKLKANNVRIDGELLDGVDVNIDDSEDLADDEGPARSRPLKSQQDVNGSCFIITSLTNLTIH